MALQSVSAYQTKLYQVAFGLVLVVLGVFAIRSMASGSLKSGGLVVGGLAAMALVMALDRRYWLLIPLLGTTGVSIPGLPFSGGELAQIAVVGTHFARLGMHRDRAAKLDSSTWPVLPVFLWIAGIFCLNPTGLAIFGNKTIGFRFYMQIVLGFLTFFALASQKLDDSDCKIYFKTLVLCTCVNLLKGILIPQADPDAIPIVGGEPERSSKYAFIAFGTLYMLLFAKRPISEILSSFPLLVMAGFFALFTVYSGKRQMAGRLFLIPWFAAFLRARGRMVTFVCSAVGAVLLVFLIAGDGHMYTLPKSAQRSFAIVAPAKYAKRTDDGGIRDLFRRELREHARKIIAEHPFVGRKGFAMSFEEAVWMHYGGTDDIYEGHAYAGNWHSTWYAYAADFGLPCMALFALFAFKVASFECRWCRRIPPGTYSHAMIMYLSLWTLCILAFSYTSGQSATTFSVFCLNFGLAIAVAAGAAGADGLPQGTRA